MEFENIVKLIAEYGIMIMICGIFLYAAIQLIVIFINWLKKKTLKNAHDESIDTRISIGNEIHKLIAYTLTQMEAERVQVIEFSNSVMSVAYLPFRYMTCTYEVYDLDREPVGHKLDKISTSLFSPFFAKLQDSKIYMFTPSKEQELSERSLCNLMDVDRWTACVPLRAAKGKLIGFVQVTRFNEFSESEQVDIQILGARIAELLTVLDK